MTSRFFLIFALVVSATGENIVSSVSGTVKTQESLVGNQLVVSLIALGRGEEIEHSGVNADGSFEFHNVILGSYLVQLETPSGQVLERVMTNIQSPEDRIEIRVTEPHNAGGPASTISVSELRNPISAKTSKLFQHAHQESEKRNYGKAIKLLRHTFSDPAAAPYAHLNIGVAMARSGDISSAIAEFRLAANLAPENALAHRDLASALVQTKDYRAAEVECRRSIDLDKTKLQTYWILGVALLNEGTNDVEAIQSLRYASREIPAARLVLAQYFQTKGQRDQAIEELQAALPDVDPREKERVTHWLSSLTKE